MPLLGTFARLDQGLETGSPPIVRVRYFPTGKLPHRETEEVEPWLACMPRAAYSVCVMRVLLGFSSKPNGASHFSAVARSCCSVAATMQDDEIIGIADDGGVRRTRW